MHYLFDCRPTIMVVALICLVRDSKLSLLFTLQGAHVLLLHIYKAHPPLRGTLDVSRLGGDDIKDSVKQAILHYHPDKQVCRALAFHFSPLRLLLLHENFHKIYFILHLLHKWPF